MAQLNDRQREAVEADGREILVSASAGTGKTSTMCQRVLYRVLSGKASLDRLLIVTFTVASAADMRKKMLKTFREALAKETDGRKKDLIRKQLRLLPGAKICTIDSFFNDLVRAHFDMLDISPRMRVPDKTELARLKTRAMKTALTRLSKESADDAAELMNAVVNDFNDDKLPAKLYDWYQRLENEERGIDRLLDIADEIDKEKDLPFADSCAGRYICSQIREKLEFFANEYRVYIGILKATTFDNAKWEKKRPKKIAQYESELSYIGHALTLVEKPKELYDYCSSLILTSIDRFDGDKDFDRHNFARDKFKDFVNKRASAYLDFDFNSRTQTLTKEAALLRLLHRLLEYYKEELTARKNALGLCEFSDIEHYALKLLYDDLKERKKKALAQAVADDFDEIYVDEYQDVNALQNLVFEAISKNNRYMVGDIKQSIYGFRGAYPAAFNNMRDSFPPLEDKKKQGRIFFSENYRCDRAIVDAVNATSSVLLGLCTDMKYYREDDLGYAKSEGDKGIKPTVCLITKSTKQSPQVFEKSEAAYTAKAIKAMIDGGVPAEDITILARTMNGAPALRRAFDEVGVPLDLTTHKDFFTHAEVMVMRSVLEMINNPTADVMLAGALKSPVFGFTFDELLKIRRASTGESLYTALREYEKSTGDVKCKEALAFIEKYRAKAQETPVDRLVFDVMSDLAIVRRLSCGKTAGEAARIRDNLLYFYDLIRVLSGDCTGEIGRVLSRVADMAREHEAGEGKSTLPVKGHVRMMTIHGSKGLEFPVCWLYDMKQDIDPSKRIKGGVDAEYSPRFGISFRIGDARAPQFRQKSENGAAAELHNREKQLNEYLRLLYVAQTRAINRLYISASVPGGTVEKLRFLREYTDCLPAAVNFNRNGLAMLAIAAGKRRDLFDLYIDEYPPDLQPAKAAEAAEEEGASASPDEANAEGPAVDAAVREFENRLKDDYPWQIAVDLPVKKAVSVLYPTLLDENGEKEQPDADESAHAGKTGRTAPVPPFVSRRQNGTVTPGAAERGTATHAFMQFCNFENLDQNGFDAEAKRLCADGFLDRATLDAVEKTSVENFLKSGLYKMIRQAEKDHKLFREKRFMVDLPAERFSSDPARKAQLKDETLLVQGVIDGYLIDPSGGIVLFDYKTDHFTPEQLAEPAKCEQILKDRHAAQLGYYKDALEFLRGEPVTRTLIYSFALGKEIPV